MALLYYYYFAMVYQCYLESWSPRSVSSITRPIIATKPHPHPPTPPSFFVFICCLFEGTYSLPYYFAQLFSRLIGPTCSGFVCMLARERKKKKKQQQTILVIRSSSPHPSCLVVSALFHFFFTHTIIITIFLLFFLFFSFACFADSLIAWEFIKN